MKSDELFEALKIIEDYSSLKLFLDLQTKPISLTTTLYELYRAADYLNSICSFKKKIAIIYLGVDVFIKRRLDVLKELILNNLERFHYSHSCKYYLSSALLEKITASAFLEIWPSLVENLKDDSRPISFKDPELDIPSSLLLQASWTYSFEDIQRLFGPHSILGLQALTLGYFSKKRSLEEVISTLKCMKNINDDREKIFLVETALLTHPEHSFHIIESAQFFLSDESLFLAVEIAILQNPSHAIGILETIQDRLDGSRLDRYTSWAVVLKPEQKSSVQKTFGYDSTRNYQSFLLDGEYLILSGGDIQIIVNRISDGPPLCFEDDNLMYLILRRPDQHSFIFQTLQKNNPYFSELGNLKRYLRYALFISSGASADNLLEQYLARIILEEEFISLKILAANALRFHKRCKTTISAWAAPVSTLPPFDLLVAQGFLTIFGENIEAIFETFQSEPPHYQPYYKFFEKWTLFRCCDVEWLEAVVENELLTDKPWRRCLSFFKYLFMQKFAGLSGHYKDPKALIRHFFSLPRKFQVSPQYLHIFYESGVHLDRICDKAHALERKQPTLFSSLKSDLIESSDDQSTASSEDSCSEDSCTESNNRVIRFT